MRAADPQDWTMLHCLCERYEQDVVNAHAPVGSSSSATPWRPMAAGMPRTRLAVSRPNWLSIAACGSPDSGLRAA